MRGFQLSKLRVVSPSAQPAEIPFFPGLNVITGPSETGKTYIMDCLSYMLGIKGPPKSVEQAKPYSTVLLEIIDSKGKRYTLQRDLNTADDVRLYPTPIDKWNIVAQSQPLKSKTYAKGSLSEFLLSLSGFGQEVVRINLKDKTRKLRFEDVARFCMVNDHRIADEIPPTFPSGTGAKKIHDESVLRLLITGQDDGLLRQIKEARIKRTQWVTKREVYSSWIGPIEQKLGWVPGGLFPRIETTITERKSTVEAVDVRIREHTAIIEVEYVALNGHMVHRQNIWERMNLRRARVSSIKDMEVRFLALRQQYESDLGRLEFVREGEHLLSQLGEDCCPVCGRPAHSSGVADETGTSGSLESVRAAALGGVAQDQGSLAGPR